MRRDCYSRDLGVRCPPFQLKMMSLYVLCVLRVTNTDTGNNGSIPFATVKQFMNEDMNMMIMVALEREEERMRW